MSDGTPSVKFVTADRGWTDNLSELLYYRVVHTRDDELHDATKIAELVGSEGRDVGQVFELLVQYGLASAFPRRLSDSYTHDAGLKATGKAKKSEWIAAQTPGQTKRACVAALLSWLDARDGETISRTDDFARDVRAYYFGVPFEPSMIAARPPRAAPAHSGCGSRRRPPTPTPASAPGCPRAAADRGTAGGEPIRQSSTVGLPGVGR